MPAELRHERETLLGELPTGDSRVASCPGLWAPHPTADAYGPSGAVARGRACRRESPAEGGPHGGDTRLL